MGGEKASGRSAVESPSVDEREERRLGRRERRREEKEGGRGGKSIS